MLMMVFMDELMKGLAALEAYIDNKREGLKSRVFRQFSCLEKGELTSWINFFHETKYIHLGFVFFYNSLTLSVLMDF
jgi:hypothetical protein